MLIPIGSALLLASPQTSKFPLSLASTPDVERAMNSSMNHGTESPTIGDGYELAETPTNVKRRKHKLHSPRTTTRQTATSLAPPTAASAWVDNSVDEMWERALAGVYLQDSEEEEAVEAERDVEVDKPPEVWGDLLICSGWNMVISVGKSPEV
ncbi:hypothetical protein FN846DRAFT_910859 [Sphaerosporella brunnea]|uniref:Uncharacterized protein n=1 Tax=Sphaerosporella brunnea TaxID=1250544 RepID=A0A5J5EKU1_9PEZI|nr:hypothetical protein FN846DRAFT_910859 [Sphaerosporella brunnea]